MMRCDCDAAVRNDAIVPASRVSEESRVSRVESEETMWNYGENSVHDWKEI